MIVSRGIILYTFETQNIAQGTRCQRVIKNLTYHITKILKNVGAIIIINYLPIRTIATTLAFPAELVNTPRMSSDVSEDTKNGVIFNIAQKTLIALWYI